MKKTPKTTERANEWLVSLDASIPHDQVVPLPEGYKVNEAALGPDFADGPDLPDGAGGGYAERVTAARLHVRAVDGPVRPRVFKTYAAALAEARREFAGGEASFDGIRAFDGITVKLNGMGRWHPVKASLA